MASLTENRNGKSQAAGFSGARTALLALEKGSRLRHLVGDERLVWLGCALHCFSLADYCF